MINKKLVSDFADIIGNLEIVINLESFENVKEDYVKVQNELIEWIKYYYLNKNLGIVTQEKSLEIHSLLDEIKWTKISDKTIGEEAILTDNILIRYEVIIKMINEERGNL